MVTSAKLAIMAVDRPLPAVSLRFFCGRLANATDPISTGLQSLSCAPGMASAPAKENCEGRSGVKGLREEWAKSNRGSNPSATCTFLYNQPVHAPNNPSLRLTAVCLWTVPSCARVQAKMRQTLLPLSGPVTAESFLPPFASPSY